MLLRCSYIIGNIAKLLSETIVSCPDTPPTCGKEHVRGASGHGTRWQHLDHSTAPMSRLHFYYMNVSMCQCYRFTHKYPTMLPTSLLSFMQGSRSVIHLYDSEILCGRNSDIYGLQYADIFPVALTYVSFRLVEPQWFTHAALLMTLLLPSCTLCQWYNSTVVYICLMLHCAKPYACTGDRVCTPRINTISA